MITLSDFEKSSSNYQIKPSKMDDSGIYIRNLGQNIYIWEVCSEHSELVRGTFYFGYPQDALDNMIKCEDSTVKQSLKGTFGDKYE